MKTLCTLLLSMIVLLTSCSDQNPKSTSVALVKVTQVPFRSDIYRPNNFSDSFDQGNAVGEKPKDIVLGSTTKPEHCFIVDKDAVQPNSAPYAIKFQNTTEGDLYIGKSSGEYFSRGNAGWSFFINSDQNFRITFYVQSFDPDSANPVALNFRVIDGKSSITDVLNKKTYEEAFKINAWNDVLLKLRFEELQFDLIVNGVTVAENIDLNCSSEHKFSRFLIYQASGTEAYYDDFVVAAAPEKPIWVKLNFAHTHHSHSRCPWHGYIANRVHNKDCIGNYDCLRNDLQHQTINLI